MAAQLHYKQVQRFHKYLQGEHMKQQLLIQHITESQLESVIFLAALLHLAHFKTLPTSWRSLRNAQQKGSGTIHLTNFSLLVGVFRDLYK